MGENFEEDIMGAKHNIIYEHENDRSFRGGVHEAEGID